MFCRIIPVEASKPPNQLAQSTSVIVVFLCLCKRQTLIIAICVVVITTCFYVERAAAIKYLSWGKLPAVLVDGFEPLGALYRAHSKKQLGVHHEHINIQRHYPHYDQSR